ncbi:hypothetical protein O6H91_11G047800 [Diphasiastrum complanatum]|uniref:Uncharacterized protein n=1 Tax=Diphasiastrum complanatum TaxID=34168 RepID=A0ACC2C8V2_DIPCM|nr:hypothetical protein O6H91_11G047800 [Diphasiastrum complanatum]
MGNLALINFSICFAMLILQLGWAFEPTTYTSNFQYEIANVIREIPVPHNFTSIDGSCAYSRSDGVETFQLLNPDANRVEIRIHNKYSHGTHVFHGEVQIFPPLNDECLMQVFGSSRPGHATLFMLRGFNQSEGSLKRYNQEVLATCVYNRWVDVRIVHAQNRRIRVYIDRVKVGEWPDTDYNKTNYFKYGVYGTLGTDNAQAQWRNVRYHATTS